MPQQLQSTAVAHGLQHAQLPMRSAGDTLTGRHLLQYINRHTSIHRASNYQQHLHTHDQAGGWLLVVVRLLHKRCLQLPAQLLCTHTHHSCSCIMTGPQSRAPRDGTPLLTHKCCAAPQAQARSTSSCAEAIRIGVMHCAELSQLLHLGQPQAGTLCCAPYQLEYISNLIALA